MTKKKKIEFDPEGEMPEGGDTAYETTFKEYINPKSTILQEPKVTDVARLRAQKALEANVKRGKK